MFQVILVFIPISAPQRIKHKKYETLLYFEYLNNIRWRCHYETTYV